jgi:hypothetical protein
VHHLLSAFLMVTATTAPKKSSTPSALLWGLIFVEFAVGLGLAELRRWMRGSYPWRMHSVIWGLFMVLTYGVAIVALAVAWFTTRARPTDTPGRLGPGGRPTFRDLMMLRRPQPGPAGPDKPPSGVVPGTYGTSLPPHAEDQDTFGVPFGEPAGWRPDPTGRHEYRYWNGTVWSRHVADKGRRSVDAM